MVDPVAKALCYAAGTSIYADENKHNRVCSCCEKKPDGTTNCMYWESFRGEARAAIVAAYEWHKKERRWPGFVRG